MIVLKSKLIGYCHGVSSTINLAQNCIKKAEKAKLPCYSIGQLIHNSDTVREFEAKGLKIIENPEDQEPGIALIRAHGITDELRKRFEEKGFVLFDSTCNNIEKTKALIQKAAKKNRPVVVIGRKGHAETVCLMGCSSSEGNNLKPSLVSSFEDLSLLESFDKETPFLIVTQTTFPEELYWQISQEILNRFPKSERGNRLCQACIIRKNKSLELAEKVDVIVVVGGKNSENTKNMASFVSKSGKPVILIENVSELDEEKISYLKQFKTAGVCSGTSTPIQVIDEVCKTLERLV